MKYSPPFAGFLQAAGLALYVGLFVAFANYLGNTFAVGTPVLGMFSALFAFVTSALICGTIALGYPLYLFSDGEKRRAMHVVFWTAGWLVVGFILILVAGYSFSAFTLAPDPGLTTLEAY
jgi:hypothetical protein